MEEINAHLLQLQEKWARMLLEPYVDEHPETTLSKPYYLGLAPEYLCGARKIMIVGQETKGFGSYTDDWPASDIQAWCIGYLRRQLWGVGTDAYNHSPFWQFFRLLDGAGYTPCWNNIDKIHRPGSGKIARLSREQEARLCGPYGTPRASLLQREIVLCAPDAVLFITGPQYCYPMSLALNVSEGQLWRYRPTVSTPVVDITAQAALGCKVLWTYHPAFLNRRRMLQQAVADVVAAIEKG